MCQGDIRTNPRSERSNTQCTCMALTFLAFHNEGVRFDTACLDKVLVQGDVLYEDTIQHLLLDDTHQSDLLTMEQLPNRVFGESNVYSTRMDMSDLKVGPLNKTKGKNYSLAQQLQCLSTDLTHAVLMVHPECFAVFRDGSGRYGFFDSHSRNAWGMPVSGGKAIMLTFEFSLPDIFPYNARDTS